MNCLVWICTIIMEKTTQSFIIDALTICSIIQVIFLPRFSKNFKTNDSERNVFSVVHSYSNHIYLLMTPSYLLMTPSYLLMTPSYFLLFNYLLLYLTIDYALIS